VRWQTQDADAAQLRDQLRQAARTWHEHGRSDDMLWTGSAFREFDVWRERYPGGLSELEEAFARAMTLLATRRRRRRRIAATAAVALALVIAVVFGALWRRSVLETRRAEAAKLLALAQVALDEDPTEALAYTTASLELADTHEARVFAVRALWAAPPLRVLDTRQAAFGQFPVPTFSPDGRWLALAGLCGEYVLVYDRRGGEPILLGGHAVSADGPTQCGWSRDNLLVTGHSSETRVRVWSMPEGTLVNTIEFGETAWWQVGEEHLRAQVGASRPPSDEPWPLRLVQWRLPNCEAEELGTVDVRAVGAYRVLFESGGGAWLYSKGNDVYARPLPIVADRPEALLGRHSTEVIVLANWRRAGEFYSRDSNGEIYLWTMTNGTFVPGRRLRKPESAPTSLLPDPGGRFVLGNPQKEDRVRLWDLVGLPGARPLELLRSAPWYFSSADFHPQGDWVVATTNKLSEASFWPLHKRFPVVVEGYDTFARRPVVFTPDGRYLVTNWGQDRVRLWPLPGSEQPQFVDLMLPQAMGVRGQLAIDQRSEQVLSTGYNDGIFVLSLDRSAPRQLEGFPASNLVEVGDFSPSGRLVAAASMISDGRQTLRVWDLETGAIRVIDLEPPQQEGEPTSGPETGYEHGLTSLRFADESTLYGGGWDGVHRWNLETGAVEVLDSVAAGSGAEIFMSADRTMLLTLTFSSDPQSRTTPAAVVHDLQTGAIRDVDVMLASDSQSLAIDPAEDIMVQGCGDGSIRVGKMAEREPHRLFGHNGVVSWVAISPDNEWIASSGDDQTLRLWPMPDLSKPPLHTKPHDELLAKLKSLTNLRAVRDEASATGWKIEIGPFPGWETAPTW
jgi:WD40 repeat protein